MSEEKKQEDILETEEVEVMEEGQPEQEEADTVVDILSPEQELKISRAETVEQRDQFMRLAAEFENYKKRMARDKQMALKYAGEPIFREILPTLDNLERAVSQGEVEGVEPEIALASLLEGVQLTLKSLTTTLEKFEVTPIVSVGEPFDPTNHEALTMEASDTLPANHVLTEFEKGYQYKDRLLRAAKVIVSSGDK